MWLNVAETASSAAAIIATMNNRLPWSEKGIELDGGVIRA
jgi:hypothetical protein